MIVLRIASHRSLRRVLVLVGWVVIVWIALTLSTDLSASPDERGVAAVTAGYAASQVLPGCVLLSASEDPAGARHGINHPYEGYPIVMTLACISLNDVETAAAMLPVEIEPRSEALARGDVAPY